MSTAAVSSSSSIYQELQSFFQQRNSEVAQLGKDLTAGNVATAQQDFATLQSLGQGGPFANGDAFAAGNVREQDFTAIGQALQSGNLSAAQQAFAQLESTYKNGGGGGSDSIASAVSAAASGGTPVSASINLSQSLYQQLRAYYQARSADVSQLGSDLATGNSANAAQDIAALQALGQNGPFKSGDPFGNKRRESDFAAIGQALQSGDLAGASKAFAQLEATFRNHHRTSAPVRHLQTTNAAPTSGLDTTA